MDRSERKAEKKECINLNDITSLTNMLKQYEEILTESDDDTINLTEIKNFKPFKQL